MLLSRAVLASYAELQAGTVSVELGSGRRGFVRASSLAFLPADPAEGERQRALWSKEYLTPAGLAATWAARPAPGGATAVTLRVADDAHARATVVDYETDGTRLLAIAPLQLESGALVALVALSAAAVAVVVVSTGLFLFRPGPAPKG